MKNLKPLLIPVGLIVLVVGIVAFTNPKVVEEDEKCTIKIIKIVNGVKTVTDSTFDCSDKMTWISSLGGEEGDSLHKMIKMMLVENGDSNSFSFNINIETDGENGMKFKAGNGEEIGMHFDMEMLDGKDGVMKMIINGKEMEIKMGDIQNHIKVLAQNIKHTEDDDGNIKITIDNKDGKESSTVEIIKTVDDDGNVTVKKIVDGKEVELDEKDMMKMKGGHQMIFISNDGETNKMEGNHEMTIDVNIESEDGKEMKRIVIISKITSSDKSDKKIAKTVNLDKKELAIEKLKFSPNPNDGKFDLSFNLDKKQTVQIKIVDIQGKEVYNETVNNFDGSYSNNINISNNGEGIYILQIIQGKKASTSKIVIK